MTHGAWKTVYDSVAGTSHRTTELPCQDACRVVQLKTPRGVLLVACCADGAGSASHSAEGSEIVCDTFVKLVERDIGVFDSEGTVNQELVLRWIEEIRSGVERRAEEVALDVRQLASTCLAAVVGEATALFIQIGDGAIAVLAGDGYEPVFWPQSGEFANTTNFITDERCKERVQWSWWPQQIDEVALFSDGLERLALRFADRTVHAPFLKPLFMSLRMVDNCDDYFEPLRRFLDSPKVNERTDDDKTLILATRLFTSTGGDAVH